MAEARKIGPLTIRPEVTKGKETGRWFIEIPATLSKSGKRMRPRYPSRTAAENIARELKRTMEQKKLGYVEAPLTRGAFFREAVARWKEELELNARTGSLRASTLRTIGIRIKPLLSYFGGHDVANLTTDDIKRYQVRRLDAKLKPVTINGELRTLHQILGWLLEQGEITKLPKVPRLKEQRRWLEIPTPEDVVKLLGYLKPSVRVLVWLMTETGLRPDEARNLPWAHVRPDEGAIIIQPFAEWQPKTSVSARFVYPSEALMKELVRLPKESEFVFPGRVPCEPIKNIRSSLQTAAKRAGLYRDGHQLHITPKLFRKAFATELAKQGVNQSILGSMMGHAPGSKMTEQFYIFVREGMKQENRFRLFPPSPAERIA